jgi:hypothetical protein
VPDRYVRGGCDTKSRRANDWISVVGSVVESDLRDGAVIGESIIHMYGDVE